MTYIYDPVKEGIAEAVKSICQAACIQFGSFEGRGSPKSGSIANGKWKWVSVYRYCYKDKKISIEVDGIHHRILTIHILRRRFLDCISELVYCPAQNVFRPGLWIDHLQELARMVHPIIDRENRRIEAYKERERLAAEKRNAFSQSPVDDSDVFK